MLEDYSFWSYFFGVYFWKLWEDEYEIWFDQVIVSQPCAWNRIKISANYSEGAVVIVVVVVEKVVVIVKIISVAIGRSIVEVQCWL